MLFLSFPQIATLIGTEAKGAKWIKDTLEFEMTYDNMYSVLWQAKVNGYLETTIDGWGTVRWRKKEHV